MLLKNVAYFISISTYKRICTYLKTKSLILSNEER